MVRKGCRLVANQALTGPTRQSCTTLVAARRYAIIPRCSYVTSPYDTTASHSMWFVCIAAIRRPATQTNAVSELVSDGSI